MLILKRMVNRHLKQPHDFYCLSDRQISDLNCLVVQENWPGWWNKLLLFRYAGGQVLYLDLDVVVVGNLDRLVSEQLSMPANWAQSGHGGCQSSVMSWNANMHNLGFLADTFEPEILSEPKNGNYGYYQGLWGDQEYITDRLGEPGGEFVRPMEHVVSYKYHCRAGGVPKDTAVVCFHGDPKPGAVRESWVVAERSFT